MTKERKKKKRISGNPSVISALKLFSVIILAFLSALCFRGSSGIIAMTPLWLIGCGIASFIGTDTKTKLIVFGVTVFIFNTVEQSDTKIALIYTALCLLACGAFEISARFIKNSKKRGYVIMSFGVIACIALSFVFIGDPFKAAEAKNTIENYIEVKYPQADNAALGEFEFSDIYYDHNTKAYYIDAVSSRYPTEQGSLSTDGNFVSDSFESIMEEKITEPYVLEITELLRKYFPDDSFDVRYDEIASLPDSAVLSSAEGGLYGSITFEIHLGGIQTADRMLETAERYINVIDSSDIGYAKIIFKSGTGSWLRRSITVSSNRPEGAAHFELEYVHAGTSNFFNRYISRLSKTN